MVKATFTQLFLKGNLKGLTYDSSLTFQTVNDAELWAKGVNMNTRLGHIDYKLTNYRLYNQEVA